MMTSRRKEKIVELKIKDTNAQTGGKIIRFDVFLSLRGLKDNREFSQTVSVDSGKISITVLSHVGPYGIRFFRIQLSNGHTYPISVTCPTFDYKNEKLYPQCSHTSNDYDLESITGDADYSSFDVKIKRLLPNMWSPTTFQTSLYEDTDMTDFELYTEGGSVKVHKVVLAVASPVFKAILTSDWKEASEGLVEVPEITKETLEYFKKYMYLHSIENNISCENLLQLLELASCYMMPEMEQMCLHIVEKHISGKNIWTLWNTVTQTKNGKLMTAILRNMNEEKISAIEKEICEPEETDTE